MRSSASSFNLQYSFLSLRSSSISLRLLHRPTVNSILPSTFPSTNCFRRQFLRKMWPIQLTFLPFIVLGYSSPSWLYAVLIHFSHDMSNWYLPFFLLQNKRSPSINTTIPWESNIIQYTWLHVSAYLILSHLQANRLQNSRK